MDANFLNIRIISNRNTATFQFVPLVPQAAYYTNIFATLLISTIYDLKKTRASNKWRHKYVWNYFQQSIFSRSCFLPLVPLVAQVAQIEKWLYLVRKEWECLEN